MLRSSFRLATGSMPTPAAAQAGLLNYQSFYFGATLKYQFGTEHPSKSNRYQRGLYHGKTHGQRRQRCFSMKYSLITMKPNVMRRTFFSQLLGMNLRVWVSMKARRTIMKRGSFDNYILRTNPKQLDSKFGLLLRSLMKKKEKDPKFKVPLIAGQANLPRTRSTKYWEYRNVPSIYLPATANLHADQTKIYLKTPQEMSRYEIAELEKEIQELNTTGDDDATLDEATVKAQRETPEYRRFLAKVKILQKMRHGVIKRYFDKFKYKKNHRNDIIAQAEETEESMREILREDHVHFLDANPEMREFLEQVNKDQAAKIEQEVVKTGRKQGDLPDIHRLEQDKPSGLGPRQQKQPNHWEHLMVDVKAVESPSSMTEDSDEKEALAKRSVKLSYSDLGVSDIKTTADETTSASESTPEMSEQPTTDSFTVSSQEQEVEPEVEKKQAAMGE